MTAITLATDREPWVRQPRESEKQWVAFQAFLAVPPPRTIPALSEQLGNKSASHLYDWSSKNRWQERAAHYDAFIQRSLAADLVEQRREMNERHAKLAKAMSGKVAQRIQNLDPDELSPGELGRWMQVLSMVERMALGEGVAGPQPNVQVNVGVNVETPQVEPTLDTTYIGEVMDRLARLGIVPEPLAIEEGELVEDD